MDPSTTVDGSMYPSGTLLLDPIVPSELQEDDDGVTLDDDFAELLDCGPGTESGETDEEDFALLLDSSQSSQTDDDDSSEARVTKSLSSSPHAAKKKAKANAAMDPLELRLKFLLP